MGAACCGVGWLIWVWGRSRNITSPGLKATGSRIKDRRGFLNGDLNKISLSAKSNCRGNWCREAGQKLKSWRLDNMTRKKVLLIELNEITWDLIDPLISRGKLPTFAWLKENGTWATPMSVDLPPQLDPWITWTTVYTGRPQEDHNVYFLEQPPESIRAQRIWEICHDEGLRVGIYGSLCSWPPQQVNGFYVPDTFAQGTETFPDSLSPIQELNLTYTRSIRLPADQDGLWFKAQLGAKLFGMGLSAATVSRIASQLAMERVDSGTRWKRVSLQPLVNFDFFKTLYQRYHPDFATFHSNHVAHYMHTYWKAMQPEKFSIPTSSEEVRQHGGAIEYGYVAADALLKRVLAMIDNNTVLVVASSMGQKPFKSHLKNGKPISQLKSLDRLIDILDLQGRVRALSTMSDQFNFYPDSEESRDLVINRLKQAYIDTPDRSLFHIFNLGDSLTVNLQFHEEVSEDSRCFFPHLGSDVSYRYGDLIYNTGLVKSGCHDPRGMMILYGAGINSGGQISECNNLDIAPTLLTLLGLGVPSFMKGRVLTEAFEAAEGQSVTAFAGVA